MIRMVDVDEFDDRLAVLLLREAFAHLPSGVVAVCGKDDSGLVGMAASSFTWVSTDPPFVCFFVDQKSRTWLRLREVPTIGISILSEGQDWIARTMASRAGDRFAGIDLQWTEAGVPLIARATAWFECRLEKEVEAGDHVFVLLRVLSIDADPAVDPLVYHRSGYRVFSPVEP